jgi:hypothetical protein
MAAVLIQAEWRRFVACENFNLLIDAVISLQSISRARFAKELMAHKKALRAHRRKVASTCIQSFYRGYSARSHYDINHTIYQIILIQSLVRRRRAIEMREHLERLNYLLMVSLVRMIQRAYRRHKRGSTITKRLLIQHRQTYGEYSEGNLESRDNRLEYVLDTSDEFESKCCEVSRCGLSDAVHEILMESGKFLYETFGDPTDVEVAENLISVMEMGEEASGYLRKQSIYNRTKKVEKSSVEIIQSKWRSYIVAKRVRAMKKKTILLV